MNKWNRVLNYPFWLREKTQMSVHEQVILLLWTHFLCVNSKGWKLRNSFQSNPSWALLAPFIPLLNVFTQKTGKSKQQLLVFKSLPVIAGTKGETPMFQSLWQPDLEFLISLSFFPTSLTRKEDLSLRTWFFDLENWTVGGPASWFWLRAEALPGPLLRLWAWLLVFSTQENSCCSLSPVLKCQCKTGWAEGRGMP